MYPGRNALRKRWFYRYNRIDYYIRIILTILKKKPDLTDLLKDEIVGPASFDCNGKDCIFSEPAMDDLISAVFGDDSIFLNCNSGECLHYTMVPGFEVKIKKAMFIKKRCKINNFYIYIYSVVNVLLTGS